MKKECKASIRNWNFQLGSTCWLVGILLSGGFVWYASQANKIFQETTLFSIVNMVLVILAFSCAFILTWYVYYEYKL